MWTCNSQVLAVLADENSVVEVLGGFAVDGNDGQLAKIAAAGGFLLVQVSGGARLLENLGRENMGQMMLADDDFDVHTKIVFPAQDLDDPAARGTGRGRPVGDFHVDHHALQVRSGVETILRADILTNDAMWSCSACGRRLLQAKGDEDGLGHPLIERGYRISRRMLVKRIMEDAHHGWVAAAEDPGDAPAAPSVGPGRRQFYQHLVALHGAIHLVGRNEDVIVTASLAGFRPHKAKAVAMHIQAAG